MVTVTVMGMQGKLWAGKEDNLILILDIGNREHCRLLCESLNTYVGGTVEGLEGSYDSIKIDSTTINWHKLTSIKFLGIEDVDRIREFVQKGYTLEWEPSY